MSFAGSVLSMIVSLKNNARPKRKPFKGYNEQEKGLKFKTQKPHHREIPAEEMEAIKSQIRIDADKDNRRRFLIILIFGFCALSLIVLISILLYQEQQIAEKQTHRRDEQETRILNEKFILLIHDGYEYLEKGKHHNAKFLFNEASELIPGDYRAKIATLKAYIYDCKENNIDCDTAEQLLNQCLAEYPADREVIELTGLLGN